MKRISAGKKDKSELAAQRAAFADKVYEASEPIDTSNGLNDWRFDPEQNGEEISSK